MYTNTHTHTHTCTFLTGVTSAQTFMNTSCTYSDLGVSTDLGTKLSCSSNGFVFCVCGVCVCVCVHLCFICIVSAQGSPERGRDKCPLLLLLLLLLFTRAIAFFGRAKFILFYKDVIVTLITRNHSRLLCHTTSIQLAQTLLPFTDNLSTHIHNSVQNILAFHTQPTVPAHKWKCQNRL